ncbi:MAG: hypothetical protein KatS3mg057_3114 [Herpetosiphonaceae bacterium]|nr:MAG: hypothetical protein KatS3mg057_3114 [Herpetosiphonaceae bacterium]
MIRVLAVLILLAPLAFATSEHPAAADSSEPVLILLKQQADLSFAASIPNKTERVAAVRQALQRHAEQQQAPILALLNQRGVNARSFLIVNAIAAEIDAPTQALLAARPEVARIIADPPRRLQAPPQPQPALPRPETVQAVEWGIADIRADQVWSTFGVTGTGVVVAGNDTGIMWDHPALKASYRGWDSTSVSHAYHWHDSIHEDLDGNATNPCGFDSAEPCDDHGHGTHTMGTIAGADGSNQIGVAPGARWIGCRNMEQGVGTISTYLECFEWFLAPTDESGQNPRPDLAPDIINNSWSCTISEGCTGEELEALEPAVQNLTAAGILVVTSAGNGGSSCSTITTPPAIYPDNLTVGAYSSSGEIAFFSSRGPVSYNGATRVGPDLSAPGVDVRSSWNDGGYRELQGTSMAAPHVSGAAALLWSAQPELRGQIELTRDILQLTARPTDAPSTACDPDPNARPNNVYGWGRLDALAAVRSTLLPHRTHLPIIFGNTQ